MILVSKSLITNGSAIIESAEAEFNAREVFGLISDIPLLIVEGKDDIDVINNYYYVMKKPVPWKVLSGKSMGAEVAGKKNALFYYKRFKNKFSAEVYCLIDRDYDWIIGVQETDEGIYYYDFYELENYLFEEDILRLLFMKYFNCNTIERYEELYGKFTDVQPMFEFLFRARLFRELHYLDKVEQKLNSEEIIKYADICNPKLESILSGKHPKVSGQQYIDRITYYLKSEIEALNGTLNTSIVETTEPYIKPQKEIEFLQKNLSGKYLSKTIVFILENCFKENKTNRDSNSILYTLFNQWIPFNSKKYNELFAKMENAVKKNNMKKVIGA